MVRFPAKIDVVYFRMATVGSAKQDHEIRICGSEKASVVNDKTITGLILSNNVTDLVIAASDILAMFTSDSSVCPI